LIQQGAGLDVDSNGSSRELLSVVQAKNIRLEHWNLTFKQAKDYQADNPHDSSLPKVVPAGGIESGAASIYPTPGWMTVRSFSILS